MALSRPKSDNVAQPSVTVPGVAAGGAAGQGVTASAGSDVQTTSTGSQSLAGSATNGTSPYTYAWTLRTKPSGSSASISSASSATASLDGIDTGGAYVCSVQATDADGYTDTAQVTIDYAAPAAAGGWTDVMDIDFTTATTQTMTDGAENTLTGTSHVIWVDGLNAAEGSMVITNGTGLEVNFANQSGKWSFFKLKATGVSKLASGDWPRFRIAASISGLVFGANGDHIGPEATGWATTGTTVRVPRILGSLKRNSASAFVWKFYVRKGSLGTSGSNIAGSDIATSEPSSMVMEIRQAAGGVWKFDADESTTTIPAAGSMTARSAALQPTTSVDNTGLDYWAEGANLDGPYLGLAFKSSSNSSQYCVVERLVIQKLL